MIDRILLNGLWQGAFVAAVGALVAWCLPQRQAATRYAVWLTSLLAIAALPIVLVWRPDAPIPALPSAVVHGAVIVSNASAQTAAAGGSWLAMLWLAGVAVCLLRLALSYVKIAAIVRRAEPAPQLGAGVLLSDDVTIPIAAGIVRPAIVIPRRYAEALTAASLRSIILHERAHIRRFDVLGNLIQRVIEALLFFNPWVYLIGRQMVKEREAACDDWAVSATRDADEYARCLSRVAEAAGRHHAPLLTPSAMGSGRMMVGRIARLLDGEAREVKVNYFVLGISVAAFAGLGFVFAGARGVAAERVALSAGTTVAASAACTFPHGYSDVKVRNAVPPDIPKAAYRPGLSAAALVTVGPDGRPTGVKLVKLSGNAAVDHATVVAAMASTYSAAMKSCKPVSGVYLFHIETGP
ncbi:MAG: hypothetical protein JO311_06800 [Candidatus Eremiobacteraeota bacterium]|nr:hypothetical protein [Candidatus Eremiobacteraeota bacterium]